MNKIVQSWQYILSIVFITTGVLFYMYKHNDQTINSPEIVYGNYELVEFDVSELDKIVYQYLEKSFKLDYQKSLAIFFLNTDLCHPCLTNAFEYHDLIVANYNDQIQTLSVINESDIDKLNFFLSATSYADKILLKNQVNTIPEFEMFDQSLIIVDLAKEAIVLRKIIPGNIITELDFKRKVLEKSIELTLN